MQIVLGRRAPVHNLETFPAVGSQASPYEVTYNLFKSFRVSIHYGLKRNEVGSIVQISH